MTALTQFVDVDVLEEEYTTPAATATGILTIESDQVDPNYYWMIERIVCSTTSTTPTTFRLYKGGTAVKNTRGGSVSGNFDVAEGDPPLRLAPGRTVTGVWTGASLGAVGTLILEGMIAKRLQVGVNPPY